METKTQIKCIIHMDKPCSFYCSFHNDFSCVKCVTNHIQCQLQGKFEPLEDICEKVKKELIIQQEILRSKMDDNISRIKKNEDKLIILENLKNIDINTLEDFFEQMKKKAEELKSKATKQYESNFSLIKDKVNDQNKILQDEVNKANEYMNKIEYMTNNMEKPDMTLEKHVLSVGYKKELETISHLAKSEIKLPLVNEELDRLYNKEELFSELGNLTLMYNTIESRLTYFIREHFNNIINENLYNKHMETTISAKDNNNKDMIYNTNISKNLDDKIRSIEELKKEDQIYEETFTKILEDNNNNNEDNFMNENVILHQLRYSSNEIYTYNILTKTFASYELYTTSKYNIRFIIFNNSVSVIYKNHLIFIFGGEDPNNKDKTSNRVFCLNINKKTIDNKVVVYEINKMLSCRQEFSVSLVGSNVYIFSGYDSNKPKDKRIITKCEKLDLKSKKFYEIRDINYPRQWCSSINHNNTNVYVFGGINPNYINTYVEKIEKYMTNLNDWSVLKYTILGDFLYNPAIKSALLKVYDNEIMILGGNRDNKIIKDFYVFDIKKLMFLKKSEKPFLKDDDEFLNQNDLITNNNHGYLFSGYFANRVYCIEFQDKAAFNYKLEIIQPDY